MKDPVVPFFQDVLDEGILQKLRDGTYFTPQEQDAVMRIWEHMETWGGVLKIKKDPTILKHSVLRVEDRLVLALSGKDEKQGLLQRWPSRYLPLEKRKKPGEWDRTDDRVKLGIDITDPKNPFIVVLKIRGFDKRFSFKDRRAVIDAYNIEIAALKNNPLVLAFESRYTEPAGVPATFVILEQYSGPDLWRLLNMIGNDQKPLEFSFALKMVMRLPELLIQHVISETNNHEYDPDKKLENGAVSNDAKGHLVYVPLDPEFSGTVPKERLKKSSATNGTVTYMAPEIVFYQLRKALASLEDKKEKKSKAPDGRAVCKKYDWAEAEKNCYANASGMIGNLRSNAVDIFFALCRKFLIHISGLTTKMLLNMPPVDLLNLFLSNLGDAYDAEDFEWRLDLSWKVGLQLYMLLEKVFSRDPLARQNEYFIKKMKMALLGLCDPNPSTRAKLEDVLPKVQKIAAEFTKAWDENLAAEGLTEDSTAQALLPGLNGFAGGRETFPHLFAAHFAAKEAVTAVVTPAKTRTAAIATLPLYREVAASPDEDTPRRASAVEESPIKRLEKFKNEQRELKVDSGLGMSSDPASDSDDSADDLMARTIGAVCLSSPAIKRQYTRQDNPITQEKAAKRKREDEEVNEQALANVSTHGDGKENQALDCSRPSETISFSSSTTPSTPSKRQACAEETTVRPGRSPLVPRFI